MKYEYNMFTTDFSYDYGDFPGATYGNVQYNGFYIEIDKNDVINISSLEPFGDCIDVMQDVKTLEDLERFITDNYNVIDDENKDVFKELLEFIKENEKDGRSNLLSI